MPYGSGGIVLIIKKQKDDIVTFAAVGDISFCGQTGKDMLAHGPDWAFEKVLPHLSADLLFGNMESVLLPKKFPKGEYRSQRVDCQNSWRHGRGGA